MNEGRKRFLDGIGAPTQNRRPAFLLGSYTPSEDKYSGSHLSEIQCGRLRVSISTCINMKAYTIDLHQKVIDAHNNGESLLLFKENIEDDIKAITCRRGRKVLKLRCIKQTLEFRLRLNFVSKVNHLRDDDWDYRLVTQELEQ